jgi:uracil-DNA glycosylase
MINPQIEDSWKKILRDEFQKPYFAEIKKFLQKEKSE